jgi:hypothetical protein
MTVIFKHLFKGGNHDGSKMVDFVCISIPDRDRTIKWMCKSETNAFTYTDGYGATNRCGQNILTG